jgi:hypothetical protein
MTAVIIKIKHDFQVFSQFSQLNWVYFFIFHGKEHTAQRLIPLRNVFQGRIGNCLLVEMESQEESMELSQANQVHSTVDGKYFP